MHRLIQIWEDTFYTDLILCGVMILTFITSLIRHRTIPEFKYFNVYLFLFIVLTISNYITSALKIVPNQRLVYTGHYLVTFSEYLVFSSYFTNIVERKRLKEALLFTRFLMMGIFGAFYIFSFFQDKSMQVYYLHLLYGLETIALLFCLVVYYYIAFKQPAKTKMQTRPEFWISSGLTFYLVCTLPVTIISPRLAIIGHSPLVFQSIFINICSIHYYVFNDHKSFFMQASRVDILTFFIFSTLLLVVLAGLMMMMMALIQKKHIVFDQSIEQLNSTHAQALLEAQLSAQENTFQQISREIHDNISLSITLAKLYLNTLDWTNIKEASSKVESCIEILGESLLSLNDVSKALNTDLINNQGLVIALQKEIRRIRKIGLLEIEFTIKNEPIFLAPATELFLFRIVQESLNNVIKHSKATKVSVNFIYSNENLVVEVIDNGVGIPSLEAARKKVHSSGFKGINARLKTIKGSMKLEDVNTGTHLTYLIPYTDGQTITNY